MRSVGQWCRQEAAAAVSAAAAHGASFSRNAGHSWLLVRCIPAAVMHVVTSASVALLHSWQYALQKTSGTLVLL
jgi:hypothetical protein